MKKILLTGGSGFIGSNIRESYLFSKYEFITPSSNELNLSNTDEVDNYFENKEFDVVLHCATKPSHRNANDREDLFYTNVRFFENLERHKDKYYKFINLGSGAIYDMSKNNSNMNEEEIFKNMGADNHSFTKYVIGKQIQNLDNFVDLNIFGIFGKYEDYTIRFISNAICKAIFKLPITLRQNRRFSYLNVDDLPRILDFFIENDVKYHSYNITPNNFVELKDLANMVKKISNENIKIKIANEGYGLDYYGSNIRLKKEFNAKFTPIDQSIKKLFNYYKKIKNKLDYNKLLIDK